MLLLTRYILRKFRKYLKSHYREESQKSKNFFVVYSEKLFLYFDYFIILGLGLFLIMVGNLWHVTLSNLVTLFLLSTAWLPVCTIFFPNFTHFFFPFTLKNYYVNFYFYYKQEFYFKVFLYFENVFSLTFLFYLFFFLFFFFWIITFKDFLYYLVMLYSRVHYQVRFTANYMTEISLIDDVITVFLTNPKLISLTKHSKNLDDDTLFNFFFSYFPLEISPIKDTNEIFKVFGREYSTSGSAYEENLPKKRLLSGIGVNGVANGFFVVGFSVFIATFFTILWLFFYFPYFFVLLFFFSGVAGFFLIFRIRYFLPFLSDFYSTTRRYLDYERHAELSYSLCDLEKTEVNFSFSISNFTNRLLTNNLRRIQFLLNLSPIEMSFKESLRDSFDPDSASLYYDHFIKDNLKYFLYNKKKGFFLKPNHQINNTNLFFFEKLDIEFEEFQTYSNRVESALNQKYNWRDSDALVNRDSLFFNFYKTFLIKVDPNISFDSSYFFFSKDHLKIFEAPLWDAYDGWIQTEVQTRMEEGTEDEVYEFEQFLEGVEEVHGINLLEPDFDTEYVSFVLSSVSSGLASWFSRYDRIINREKEWSLFEYIFCWFLEARYRNYFYYLRWRVIFRGFRRFFSFFLLFFSDVLKQLIRLPYRFLALHDYIIFSVFKLCFKFWPVWVDKIVSYEVLLVHYFFEFCSDFFFFFIYLCWSFLRNPVFFLTQRLRWYYSRIQLSYYFYVFGLSVNLPEYYSQTIETLLFQHFQQKFYVFIHSNRRFLEKLAPLETLYDLDVEAKEEDEDNRSFFGQFFQTWEYEAKDLIVGEFFIIVFLFYCNFLFLTLSGVLVLLFFNFSIFDNSVMPFILSQDFTDLHIDLFFAAVLSFALPFFSEGDCHDLYMLDFLLFENYSFINPNWYHVFKEGFTPEILPNILDRYDLSFAMIYHHDDSPNQKVNNERILKSLKKTMYTQYFPRKSFFLTGVFPEQQISLVNDHYWKNVLFWYVNAEEIRRSQQVDLQHLKEKEFTDFSEEEVDPIRLSLRTENFVKKFLVKPINLHRRNYYSNHTFWFYSGKLPPLLLQSDAKVVVYKTERRYTYFEHVPEELNVAFTDLSFFPKELADNDDYEDYRFLVFYYLDWFPHLLRHRFLHFKQVSFDFILAVWEYHLLRIVYYVEYVLYKKYILGFFFFPVFDYCVSYLSFYIKFFSMVYHTFFSRK